MTKEMAANPMEATPIPKLVMKRSVPLMVSTLVSSLYGMVDSMFVARISEKALAATTVAFPITLFLFAIAIGTAMGVNSRLSRFLGEGEMTDAKETGWTGILLSVLSSIPFMLIGAFGLPFIYKLITADPEIAVMGQ
ncbi:MAG: MATE family efflux transporter, partial [Roseburia sp.]|nr:MATE family efflux transporter [Roseburia sp.]